MICSLQQTFSASHLARVAYCILGGVAVLNGDYSLPTLTAHNSTKVPSRSQSGLIFIRWHSYMAHQVQQSSELRALNSS